MWICSYFLCITSEKHQYHHYFIIQFKSWKQIQRIEFHKPYPTIIVFILNHDPNINLRTPTKTQTYSYHKDAPSLGIWGWISYNDLEKSRVCWVRSLPSFLSWSCWFSISPTLTFKLFSLSLFEFFDWFLLHLTHSGTKSPPSLAT